jgi:PAT family beta-lactamase induction signal transducer AmpG
MGSLAYGALAVFGKSHALLFVAVGVENMATGLCVAALDAFLMALCNKRYSATQFALLSSATSLVGRIVSGGAGYLASFTGWPAFFAITASAVIPALVLLRVKRREITAVDEGARADATAAA